MTPMLVFDLETIPDASGLRKLNNWDDLDDTQVVERAMAERQAATGSDFMPHYLHRIVAISCVFRDDNGLRVKSLGQPQDPEEVLISQFFKTIDHYTPQLVSWNGSGFDLPVLHYRSLIHGLTAARYWDKGQDDREFRFSNYQSRYHDRHLDLMDVLARYTGRANAPLDSLAKLCGFAGKLGMDGSQVWPAWLDGRIDEIRAYCETDVINTWLLTCRFKLLRGDLMQSAYDEEVRLVHELLSTSPGQHWVDYLKAWDDKP